MCVQGDARVCVRMCFVRSHRYHNHHHTPLTHAHSLTHSLTHSHSLAHPPTHPLTHPGVFVRHMRHGVRRGRLGVQVRACVFVCVYVVFKYVWFACGRVWCAGVWACMCVCARARVCV